jgi:protein phosphatase
MTGKEKQKFDAACITDTGRVRGHNEDAGVADLKRGVFVVSDGIGGHQGGEVAARLVVEALPLMIEAQLAKTVRASGKLIRTVLRDSLLMLNRQTCEYSAAQPGLAGMGATVVAVLLRAGFAHIAHMGDSRAYLLRNGELTALTDDHSVVGLLLRSGRISADEAKTHPARGRITRFIGILDDVEPGLRSVRVHKGDRLLLCSDGLTSMVADAEIIATLAEKQPPRVAARTLVDAANRAGGQDNVTVVVADVA